MMKAAPKNRIDQLTLMERLALGHFRRTKRNRVNWKFSVEMLRLREIEDLIKYRHGRSIPDPEDTDDRDTALNYVRAAAFSLTGQDIGVWCRVFAPWAMDTDLVPIIAAAAKRRHMMRADGVAGLLHVTMAERLALKFKTIGAADMTAAQRKKFMRSRKCEMDRKRDEKRRRAAGAKDRTSYVATSLSTTKPWEALKMSRRTWYRKGKPTVGTSSSRIEVIGKSEAPVPPEIGKSEAPASMPIPSHPVARVARDEGLGDDPPAGCQGAEPHGSGEASNVVSDLRRNAA